MTQTDDRILELLNESDLILSTAVIALNLDYSRSWVSDRMTTLHEAGLVDSENTGYYRISDLGREYLSGELDADVLEK